MRGAVLLLLLAPPLESGWWKLEAGPFTVYTDAGERAARETLERLELAQQVFSRPAGTRAAVPLPVIAFALASESRFNAVRSGTATRGFYQSAAQRDYIVLPWGDRETPRIILHEFSHLVFNHTLGPLPQWLEEGLAEFHSTVSIDGGRLRLGVPVMSHLRLLAANPLLSAAELGGITKNSAHYNESSRAGIFYAQTWAMVHMLRLGEAYRNQFPVFLDAVQSGEAVTSAFQRAFGKSFSDAVADLRTYLGRQTLPVSEFGVDAAPATEPRRATAVSDLEGDMAYAELALDTGHLEEAAKICRRLARHKPDSARAATAFGILALGQKQREEAKSFLQQAMRFADAPAESFFESAMLLRDTQGSREAMATLLRKAVERNPKYAEAHFMLAIHLAKDNRHDEAIQHLEQAVTIFPRQSYFWQALAISYHASGKAEPARRASQRALDSAATSQQAEMARAALRLGSAPAAPVAGDRAEGILERIECLGANARFHVRTGGKSTAFFVEKPGEILLKNLSSMTFEFRCGPQKPVPISIEYDRGTNAVIAVEFR